MPLTNDELQSFYQFALGIIENDDQADSLQDLVSKWDAQRERESVNAAIRKGHAEILAGGGKPYDEFRSEMKSKHDLSSEN